MYKNVLLFALSALLSIPIAAENSASAQISGGGGTPGGPVISPQLAIGNVQPSNLFSNAQYGTGGVGLRNRSTGTIQVSGVTGAVKGAFIYWAVITRGAPTTANRSLTLQRLSPTPMASATIQGTAIGSGGEPCWTGNANDRITVYKGSVPTSLANGNGLYRVTLLSGASGLTGGQDPWASIVLPLMEGASLVIVGTGTARVAIYDNNLAGRTFLNGQNLTYTLILPQASTINGVLFDNIGADGQHGVSRTPASGGSEVTTINSQAIAGAGSIYNDSDWNGGIASPLPQLWDTTGHDISVAAPRGTTQLSVRVTNPWDCLTPVANVVALY